MQGRENRLAFVRTKFQCRRCGICINSASLTMVLTPDIIRSLPIRRNHHISAGRRRVYGFRVVLVICPLVVRPGAAGIADGVDRNFVGMRLKPFNNNQPGMSVLAAIPSTDNRYLGAQSGQLDPLRTWGRF